MRRGVCEGVSWGGVGSEIWVYIVNRWKERMEVEVTHVGGDHV